MKARRRLDPENVLHGRAAPDAVALCALVREANPSGRDLSPREQARGYALKSRLQSLLVRRFSEQIEVVLERDGGGIHLRSVLGGLAVAAGEHGSKAGGEQQAGGSGHVSVLAGTICRSRPG